ncbi:hypothetical protein ID866_10184 [Astraeus odoratus]|nr:hypothetical protein ID866_10184 [Astraeus odoratus]
MENGNAHYYVQEQSVDPRPLLDGIAQGLLYLHSHEPHPIIHGNLKGSNVLISPEGRPVVTDFGLFPVFDPSLVASLGILPDHSLNWMPPESVDNGEVTAKGDVWAFAMTIIELFTRKIPFHDCRNMAATALAITKGQPVRPNMEDTYSRFTDSWWDLCCLCWNRDVSSRPSMSNVVKRISHILSDESGISVTETEELVESDPVLGTDSAIPPSAVLQITRRSPSFYASVDVHSPD